MKNAALAIVLDQEAKKVLLVQRKDLPIWVLPGGGIDPGESEEVAVVREVKEETGLKVKVDHLAAHYTPINRLTQSVHLYRCSVIEGTLTEGDESQAVGFFSLDHLPSPFFQYHREWLAEANAKKSYPISKPMSRSTFWKILVYYTLHPWWGIRYLMTRLRLFIHGDND